MLTSRLVFATATIACFASGQADANISIKSKKIEATYWGGLRNNDGTLALSRLSLKPSAKVNLTKQWRAEFALRFEFADDQTGLGTTTTFSSYARPLIDSETVRLEIDKATLNYKSGPTRITVGKQTMAWGVLDGLQVTDRFDPVRRRDFVFTETRPERISRWGLRWQQRLNDWTVDAGVSFDPTVSQLAEQGDAFSPTSTRFRAGIPASTAITKIEVADRNNAINDATYGVRVSRNLGSGTMSALWFSGPETDPVFTLSPTTPGAVALTYPRRSVIGATYDRAAGAVILRLEGAYIPNQPLNIVPTTPSDLIADDTGKRLLVGAGIDWNGPGGIFVNAQMALDHIDFDEDRLVRPETDSIYTIKLRKSFKNDLFKISGEVLGSAVTGDGAVSADISYDLTDHIFISFGTNLAFGNAQGTFGQFKNENRVWTRISASF